MKLDVEKITKAMTTPIIKVVGEKLKGLSDRINALEAKEFPYKGVWQASGDYQRGMFVTFEGSIWHCNADVTRAKPGSSSDWTLAVKGTR